MFEYPIKLTPANTNIIPNPWFFEIVLPKQNFEIKSIFFLWIVFYTGENNQESLKHLAYRDMSLNNIIYLFT